MTMVQDDRSAAAGTVPDEHSPAAGVPTTRSGLARAALVLGLCGLVACVAFAVVPILAVVFGLFGLRQISRSGGTRTGRREAVAGIALGAVGTVIFAVLVMTETLTLTASVGDTSLLDAEYRDNGIAFDYPSHWDEMEGVEVERTSGPDDKLFQAVIARDDRDLIVVDAYRLAEPATEDNLADLRDETEDVLAEVFADDGEILSGPTDVEGGRLAGYSYTTTLRTDEGLDLDSTFTFLFDGSTEYVVNCQSHAHQDDVRRACDQVLDTFRTT